MKKKITAFFSVLTAFILLASFNFTGARYETSVTVTGPIAFARTAGTLSLYKPEWVYGDYYTNNESFPYIEKGTYGIHFSVTNSFTANDKTYMNEVETEYYIRVVPQNELDTKLFSYQVCEYAKLDQVYTKDEDLGAYGSDLFKLGTETQSTVYFDVALTCESKEGLTGIRTLKVQMIQKRTDERGELLEPKVISEAGLRIKASDESGFVDILIDYYPLGSSTVIPDTTRQTVTVQKGTEINFLNSTKLTELGIQIPSGYSFAVDYSSGGSEPTLISYATCSALNWVGQYKFEATEAFTGMPVNVYLVRDDSIPVNFQYWDRSRNDPDLDFKQKPDTSQMLQIKKGATINFKDPSSLSALGITLPDTSVYKYIAAHCNVPRWWDSEQDYYQDSFKVPDAPVVSLATIDVYVAPIAMREQVKVFLYKGSINNKLTEITKDVVDGFVTFTHDEVKGLHAEYNALTSFDIGVFNTENGSTCIVGNPYVDAGTVTIDCFKIYQPKPTPENPEPTKQKNGYCLSNTNMRVYILAWW